MVALGEDPLIVIPRLGESERAFGEVMEEMTALYRTLVETEDGEGKRASLDRLDAHLTGLHAILVDRGNVLSQLEATLHSRLRATQRQVKRRIQWVLLFQVTALLGGSALVLAAFRTQARQVQELRGLVPICSNCKKIRDDKGYWDRVESYFHTHGGLEFTHGICPDCEEALYPDLKEESRTPGRR
jgi:hypothetical protein